MLDTRICRGSTGMVPVGDGMAQTWFTGQALLPFDCIAGAGGPQLIVLLPQSGHCSLETEDGSLRIQLRARRSTLVVVPDARGIFHIPAKQRLVMTSCHFGLNALPAAICALPLFAAALERSIPRAALPAVWYHLPGHLRLQGMAREFLSHPYHGAASHLFLESRFLEVLAILMQAFADHRIKIGRAPIRRSVRERIVDAEQILLADLKHPPSLQALAREVGLSRTQLMQGFRDAFGHAPFEWLRIQRLDAAREALENEPTAIAHVAFESGYSHTSTFSAAFRRRYGRSPLAWRRIHGRRGL